MSSGNSTVELPTICKKVDLANAQVRDTMAESRLVVRLLADNRVDVQQRSCDPGRYWVSKWQVGLPGHTRFTLPERVAGFAS